MMALMTCLLLYYYSMFIMILPQLDLVYAWPVESLLSWLLADVTLFGNRRLAVETPGCWWSWWHYRNSFNGYPCFGASVCFCYDTTILNSHHSHPPHYFPRHQHRCCLRLRLRLVLHRLRLRHHHHDQIIHHCSWTRGDDSRLIHGANREPRQS